MGKTISSDAAIGILDAAPVAVILLDARFTCLYANVAAETLTGVNTAEMVGRSLWETFPALQGSVLETQVSRALSDGKRIPFDFHYAPTARWCDVEAVPVKNGIALYMQDVTERRRALDAAQISGNGTGVEIAPNRNSSAGKTILLVDDDESMRRVTKRILSRSGFHVLEAVHGADALRVAVAHSGEIDVLLTDVLMPGIRGPELVEQLMAYAPALRVIYMSGYTDEDISRWGLEPGCAFIHKPFTADGLTAAVSSVLAAAP